MKSPLTRRRERRILAALTYFGPIGEPELYNILRTPDRSLTTALLNLAADGLVVCESRPTLFNVGNCRVWSMATPKETDE